MIHISNTGVCRAVCGINESQSVSRVRNTCAGTTHSGPARDSTAITFTETTASHQDSIIPRLFLSCLLKNYSTIRSRRPAGAAFGHSSVIDRASRDTQYTLTHYCAASLPFDCRVKVFNMLCVTDRSASGEKHSCRKHWLTDDGNPGGTFRTFFVWTSRKKTDRRDI